MRGKHRFSINCTLRVFLINAKMVFWDAWCTFSSFLEGIKWKLPIDGTNSGGILNKSIFYCQYNLRFEIGLPDGTANFQLKKHNFRGKSRQNSSRKKLTRPIKSYQLLLNFWLKFININLLLCSKALLGWLFMIFSYSAIQNKINYESRKKIYRKINFVNSKLDSMKKVINVKYTKKSKHSFFWLKLKLMMLDMYKNCLFNYLWFFFIIRFCCQ
jgi:hypothetical protein